MSALSFGGYHRQRGSDCIVLTATGLVNGEGQILTPYRIETPEPIAIKFGTRDYVRETTRSAEFGANPSTGWGGGGGLLSKYVKYNTTIAMADRHRPTK